jgi:hypothetical protein
MRIESSVTSISWIPSEAITGVATKMPFERGVAHYDQPPPDVVEGPAALDALRDEGRFRFASHLTGWADVEDGRIQGYGQGGGSYISSTLLSLGKRQVAFQPVALPDLRPGPEASDTEVTFFLTAGGRTGMPAPRRVRRAPFVQYAAPLAWTTVALTLRADGSSKGELTGASPFPRHWVYDGSGKLASKSGLINFSNWYRTAFGKHSPWGDRDSPALATEVETALERQLSLTLMSGGEKPEIRKVKEGATVTEQGAAEEYLFLVLDGVVRMEVDGERVAEYGPGSLHGERAVLEGGRRTATVRAVTACKLAVAPADRVDRDALVELAAGHRKENER